MQWVDLIIIAVIGLSALTGLFRGVVKEVIALFIWVLAIWSGYHYYSMASPWLEPYVHDQSARTVLAFIIILFGVLFAGGIINTLLGFMLKHSGLSSMDKIMGMAFGFARGVFIVSLVLATIKMTSLPHEKHLKESQFCAHFEPVEKWISGYFPAILDKIKSVDKVGSIIDSTAQIESASL